LHIRDNDDYEFLWLWSARAREWCDEEEAVAAQEQCGLKEQKDKGFTLKY
jgi:hypothetical protein